MSDFKIEDGVLNSYYGNDSMVIIPDTVTAIGDEVFWRYKKLTSVVIPNSVTSIGIMAFWDCTNLKSVVIPDSVITIDDQAFDCCSGLTNVVIGKSVTTIGRWAFQCCSRLTEVVIPNSVTSIGDSAFCACENLKSIVIPDSVMSIGEDAFHSCNSLTSIVIPDSVTSIGKRAFNCCKKLFTIYCNPSLIDNKDTRLIAYYSWINDIERLKKTSHLKQTVSGIYTRRKKFLPMVFENDMVQVLYLFADNGKITGENIDSDFLEPALEAGAKQCTAFLIDWKAHNVTPEYVEKRIEREIMKDPFNATDMRKLWSWKRLEDGTIELTKYRGNGTQVTVPARIGRTLVSSIGPMALSPAQIDITEQQAETRRKITYVEILSGISQISNDAFCRCISLAEIIIPDSVTRIDTCALSECRNLERITIPGTFDNIRTIAYEDRPYGFYYKNLLKTVIITGHRPSTGLNFPSNVEVIFQDDGDETLTQK